MTTSSSSWLGANSAKCDLRGICLRDVNLQHLQSLTERIIKSAEEQVTLKLSKSVLGPIGFCVLVFLALALTVSSFCKSLLPFARSIGNLQWSTQQQLIFNSVSRWDCLQYSWHSASFVHVVALIQSVSRCHWRSHVKETKARSIFWDRQWKS